LVNVVLAVAIGMHLEAVVAVSDIETCLITVVNVVLAVAV
jgi:hypothetical protein